MKHNIYLNYTSIYPRKALALIVFIICCITLLSPNLSFSLDPKRAVTQYGIDAWYTENGLPSNCVTAIAQTNDGYLWAGTEEGLVRFDGATFTVFNKENSSGLCHNWITKLLVDHSGNLWIGTARGFSRYENGLFISYADLQFTKGMVNAIYEDRNNNIWMGVQNTLVCLHNGIIAPNVTGFDLQHGLVLNIFEDHNNRLLVGTISGAYYVEREKIVTPILIQDVNIRTVFEDKRHDLWFGMYDGTVKDYNMSRDNKDVFSSSVSRKIGNNYISSIISDRNNNYWIASFGDGITRITSNNMSVLNVSTGLTDNRANCLFIDRDGNLWIGTKYGLNRLSDGIVLTYGKKEGLLDEKVYSVVEDNNGILWCGTKGGLVKLDRANQNNQIMVYTKKDGLLNEDVLALFIDSDNSLWFGTRGGGFSHLLHGKIKTYTTKEGLLDNHVQAIFRDAENSLWIATKQGLSKFKNGLFESFNRVNGLPYAKKLDTSQDTLLQNFLNIRALVQGRSGNFLVGTYLWGTLLYQEGKFVRIQDIPAYLHVNSLFEDNVGFFWICTYANGLYRYNPNAPENKLVAISRQNGLPDSIVYQIIEDNNNNYWISSNRGIFSVGKQQLNDFCDGKTLSIHPMMLGISDGLKSLECNGGTQPAGCKTRDGKLWFPTMRGLVMIDPENAVTVSQNTPVYINRITNDDQSYPPVSELSIPYGGKRIRFSYGAINFHDAKRIQFRYQLEGYDKSWVDNYTRREISYTQLSPGEYTFKVIASVANDEWSTEPAMVKLQIIPPFWMTSWFQGAAFVAFFSLTIGIVRYASTRKLQHQLHELEAQQALERERLRISNDMHDEVGANITKITILSDLAQRHLKEAKQQRVRDLESQRALERERSRISQDMHDEVGANLTRITMLSDLAQRHLQDSEKTESYVQKISETSRSIVSGLDEIIWFTNPKHDTLESLLFYVREYLSEFFETSEIHCSFAFPPNIPAKTLSAEIRRNLFLAIKEGANNIVKHAAATEVLFLFTIEEKKLRILLTDNGKGFAKSEISTFGNGVHNMKKRVEDAGGKFTLHTIPNEGTTISISIKL